LTLQISVHNTTSDGNNSFISLKDCVAKKHTQLDTSACNSSCIYNKTTIALQAFILDKKTEEEKSENETHRHASLGEREGDHGGKS
jgi:hypothetical protein